MGTHRHDPDPPVARGFRSRPAGLRPRRGADPAGRDRHLDGGPGRPGRPSPLSRDLLRHNPLHPVSSKGNVMVKTESGTVEPTIAIVGSGPSGCYTAQFLRKRWPTAEIVIIDRLDHPYGLVNYGVALDHPGTKAVAKQFDRLFDRDGVSVRREHRNRHRHHPGGTAVRVRHRRPGHRSARRPHPGRARSRAARGARFRPAHPADQRPPRRERRRAHPRIPGHHRRARQRRHRPGPADAEIRRRTPRPRAWPTTSSPRSPRARSSTSTSSAARTRAAKFDTAMVRELAKTPNVRFLAPDLDRCRSRTAASTRSTPPSATLVDTSPPGRHPDGHLPLRLVTRIDRRQRPPSTKSLSALPTAATAPCGWRPTPSAPPSVSPRRTPRCCAAATWNPARPTWPPGCSAAACTASAGSAADPAAPSRRTGPTRKWSPTPSPTPSKPAAS